jgi:hypothetical protein
MRSNLGQKAVATAAIALTGALAIALLRSGPADDRSSAASEGPRAEAKDPRMILGRLWFDRLPRSRTDTVDLWIFLGGGIGLEEKGAYWRSSIDFFDFERQGSRLDITFLHDKAKQAVAFEITSCDEPPFDLCVDFKEPLRGQKRLYSWGDDEDMERNVPWSRQVRAAAAARARHAD